MELSTSDLMIVSGGDATYCPMIEELHQSIIDANPNESVPFGVIDAGLTPDQSARLRERGAQVAALPDDKAFPRDAMRRLQPHLIRAFKVGQKLAVSAGKKGDPARPDDVS